MGELDAKEARTKTPFQFKEQQNQVYSHDVKIFIQGADVTPWVTSQINLTRMDRTGMNTLTFSLSNAMRAFEMTEENLNYGDPDAEVDEDTGEMKKKDPKTGRTSATGKFRVVDPYGAGHGTSELAKYQIFTFKNQPEINYRHKVAKYGKSTDPKKKKVFLVDADEENDADNATETTTPRYLFSVGSLVFHKYDPVRFFVKNPLSSGDDEWTCEFAGYIDTKPYSQNYVNGESIINVTCQDIRIYMQSMRTQTNTTTSVGNEKMIFFKNDPKCIADDPKAGLFADLRLKNRGGHPLFGQTFLESINFLLFGVVTGISRLGRVGKLTKGVTLRYFPVADETRQENGKAILEKWNNIINFGAFPLPVAADAEPKAPVTATQGKDGGPLPDAEENTSVQGEADKAGKLGTVNERFLTKSEMMAMGRETKDGGTFSPDVARVHFLLPPDISGVSNLVEGITVDTRKSARVEWATRLEVIQQLCKSIDYQFYVTGMGDVVFEFPMYDFKPGDYNETYSALYTFNGHVVSDTINDEGGTPISGLEVTSRYLNATYAALPQNPGSTDLQSWELRVTAYSNVLASRFGVHIESFSLPGITNNNKLAQYALIEFNKRLANFNKFDMQVSYRPFMGINRPLLHQTKRRMALSDSLTYSWKIREEVSLEINLSYVRRLEGENFRFISGGERQPISYRTLFSKDKPSTAIPKNGAGVMDTKTGDIIPFFPGEAEEFTEAANSQSFSQSMEANSTSGTPPNQSKRDPNSFD